MIARLKGRIEAVLDGAVILDVNGVGYLVSCPGRTLSRLGGVGEAAALWVETVVREDAILLFGFLDRADQDWFRLLTTVQGVGVKVALAILSVADAEALATAVAAGDRAVFVRANGVGAKLAQRILSELKDKVAGFALPVAAKAGGAAAVASGGIAADAASALANLGYGPSEAFAAVSRAMAAGGEPPATVEDLISRALRMIAASQGANR